MVKAGDFNDHIFVSIVRLTVETNLVTSKDLSSRCHNVSSVSRSFSQRQCHSFIFGHRAPRE